MLMEVPHAWLREVPLLLKSFEVVPSDSWLTHGISVQRSAVALGPFLLSGGSLKCLVSPLCNCPLSHPRDLPPGSAIWVVWHLSLGAGTALGSWPRGMWFGSAVATVEYSGLSKAEQSQPQDRERVTLGKGGVKMLWSWTESTVSER